MFLHQLTPAQRRVFCRLAQHLIALDQVVDIREEVALESSLREMGLRAAELPPAPRTLDEVLPELAALDTLESRRVLVLELALVACADRSVELAELPGVPLLLERLDVEEELLPRLQAFARDHHRLVERGKALISPDWDQSGEGWIDEDEG